MSCSVNLYSTLIFGSTFQPFFQVMVIIFWTQQIANSTLELKYNFIFTENRWFWNLQKSFNTSSYISEQCGSVHGHFTKQIILVLKNILRRYLDLRKLHDFVCYAFQEYSWI